MSSADRLLSRVMFAVDGKTPHRDGAGLDIRANPVFDDVREHLALLSAQPVLDGEWVVVPREPTEAMLRAPDDAGVGLYSREVFAMIYRAMLAPLPDSRGEDLGSFRASPSTPGGDVDAWRPIETAPRDGAHIIINEGDAVIEARWVDDGGWWARNNDPTDHWGEEWFPTHWMPLPAPPRSSPKDHPDSQTSGGGL